MRSPSPCCGFGSQENRRSEACAFWRHPQERPVGPPGRPKRSTKREFVPVWAPRTRAGDAPNGRGRRPSGARDLREPSIAPSPPGFSRSARAGALGVRPYGGSQRWASPRDAPSMRAPNTRRPRELRGLPGGSLSWQPRFPCGPPLHQALLDRAVQHGGHALACDLALGRQRAVGVAAHQSALHAPSHARARVAGDAVAVRELRQHA